MRSRFDEQLSTLNEELTRMGALCEEVISLADRALGEGDAEAAKRSRRSTPRSTGWSIR